MMCEGCTNEQHYFCGMQTWCECPCDGSTDWAMYEPTEEEEMEHYRQMEALDD